MINFGFVTPGETIHLPFDSFASATGASITLTGLAVTDIEIYKDGGTTQRASDNGYTLLDTDGIDFDGITGIHGFSIDLADNSTAGFYAAGSRYFIVVSSVTVDSSTVNFLAGRFVIGYPAAVLNTTIATLATQTSFTLTTGPAEDDALNGMWLVVHDVASVVQKAIGIILDYTGSTKTVTLAAAPTFTVATTDNISVMGPMPLQPTVTGRTLDLSAGGEAGLDWANIGSPTTSQTLSGTTVAAVTGAVGSVTGAVGSVTGAVGSVTGNVGGNVNGSVASVTADVGITQGAADKVWLSASRTLTSFGTLVADVATAVWGAGTRTLTGFSTALAVSVWDVLAAAVTTASSIGLQLKTNIDATISSRLATAGYTTPPTVGAIADQVWDEVLAGHLTAGSTGFALNAAGSAADPWSVALPGAYGAGSAGFIVGTNLDATISSRSSHNAADVWAVGTRTITGGSLTVAPPTAAAIAAQIIATALAELAQAEPPDSPTVGEALMLPYQCIAQGGTMNASTGESTYRNGAGVVFAKRTLSDDGNILTEGKLVAGP